MNAHIEKMAVGNLDKALSAWNTASMCHTAACNHLDFA